MNIQKKLIEVQSKLKVKKNNFNQFGDYYYRSCEDILENVKPILKEQDLCLIISDEIVLIGDRYYVKATAKIFDENEEISVSAYAREEESKKKQDQSQITGSTSSYARKYALNGLFCIDDTKDADSLNNHDDYIKQDKINILKDLLSKLEDPKTYEKQILSFNKVNKLEELTETQYAKALYAIKRKTEQSKDK